MYVDVRELGLTRTQAPRVLGVAPREIGHDLSEALHQYADVVLRLLPSQAQNRLRDTLFGITFLPTLASVYYEYAVRLANSDKAAPTILGCAIAHEVGIFCSGGIAILVGESCTASGGPKSSAWH